MMISCWHNCRRTLIQIAVLAAIGSDLPVPAFAPPAPHAGITHNKPGSAREGCGRATARARSLRRSFSGGGTGWMTGLKSSGACCAPTAGSRGCPSWSSPSAQGSVPARSASWSAAGPGGRTLIRSAGWPTPSACTTRKGRNSPPRPDAVWDSGRYRPRAARTAATSRDCCRHPLPPSPDESASRRPCRGCSTSPGVRPLSPRSPGPRARERPRSR